MENKDKEQILKDFQRKLIEGQRDLDPDIAQFVNDHFWELIDGTENRDDSEKSS